VMLYKKKPPQLNEMACIKNVNF